MKKPLSNLTSSLLTSICSIALLLGTTSNAVDLVRAGKPLATIYHNAQAPAEVSKAADDLRTYIQRMSGASLPVVTLEANENPDPDHPAIILVDWKGDPTLVSTTRSRDAFRYWMEEGQLRIAAESSRGLHYAVFDLLEFLGCGWYTPGELGEVIPHSPTLTLPDDLDHSEKSDSINRRFWYGGGGNREVAMEGATDQWRRRNKTDLVQGSWRHAWNSLVPKELFEEHPDYFTLKNGNRSTHQLCTTEPAVVRIASESLLRKMAELDDLVIPAGPNDGGGLCECLDCAQWHTPDYLEPSSGKPCYSDLVFKFANELASTTSKKYPGKDLGILVYSEYSRPPLKIDKLHPNVFPMMAPIRRCRLHGPGNPLCHWNELWGEEIQAWAGISQGKLGFYPYNYNLADGLVPFTKFDFYKRLVREVHKADVEELAWVPETLDSWATHAPHLYLSARLLWNSHVDIEAELDRFFHGFYGKAAQPMSRYWRRIDQAYANTDTHTGSQYGLHHIWTNDLLVKSREDIEKARRAAASGRERSAVEMAEAGLRCAELFIEIWNNIGELDFIAADQAQQELRQHITEHANGNESSPSWFHERYAWGYFDRFVGRTVSGGAAILRNNGRIVVKLPEVWKFKRDPNSVGLEQEWWAEPGEAENGWEKLATFSKSWDDQGLGWYHGQAWYRTDFQLPESIETGNLHLWFGGVDHNADVYLNGQSLGEQKGFATPLAFEKIGSALVPGQRNSLVVRVESGGLAELGTGGIMMPVMIYKGDPPSAGEKAKGSGVEYKK